MPCAEPKEHKHFRPGARPWGMGDRGDRDDREIVYVLHVYVPVLAPDIARCLLVEGG